MRDIASNHSVIAMIGVTGTAPATAILNSSLLATALGASAASPLALLGSYTGARALRSPFKRHVINYRAGYDDELAAQIDMVLARSAKTNPTIYLFRQDDSFGDAGETALKLAARFHLLNITCKASYVRNGVATEPGLAQLVACGLATGLLPDAIVMIGTALPLAKFAAAAEATTAWVGRGILYSTVSFVGTESFLAALPASLAGSERVFVTEVVPPLTNTSTNLLAFPVLAPFLTALAALGDGMNATVSHYALHAQTAMLDLANVRGTCSDHCKLDHHSFRTYFFLCVLRVFRQFGAFEGYLIGRLAIYGIDRALSDTSAAFVSSFYTGSVISLDGLLLGPLHDGTDGSGSAVTPTASKCNQGSANVYPVSFPSLGVATQAVFDAGASTCGVLPLYSDAVCAPGSAKVYSDPTHTLTSSCEACAPGTFNSDGLFCQACPAGFITSVSGATYCTGCLVSQYQNLPGQNSCPKCCDTGYSATANNTLCTACEDNAFTNQAGASSSAQCVCKRGYYAANNVTGELPLRGWSLAYMLDGQPHDSVYLDCQPCPNARWAEPGEACLLPSLTVNDKARSALAALSGVGLLVTLVSCALLWRWRQVPLIKASSPALMGVLQLGCVLAFLVPILGSPYPSSTPSCQAQLFLGHLAWTCLFGAALLKCFRLRTIFLMGSRRLKKVVITDAMLFRRIGLMLAAQIIYISIWLAVSPVESTPANDSSRTFFWCSVRAGGSSLWSALLLAWDASLLLYGVWLCISIRSFHGVWNESKQLGIVSYNTALIAAVGLVAVYALIKDENAFNLLLGVAILLVVFLLQGVLFFYKYWQVCQLNEDGAAAPSTGGGGSKGHGQGHTSGTGSHGSHGSADSADASNTIKLLRTQLAEQTAKVRTLTAQLQQDGRAIEGGSSGAAAAAREAFGERIVDLVVFLEFFPS